MLAGLQSLGQQGELDITAGTQLRDALRLIMKRATPEQRAICLGILEDKTHSEIGDELGLSARAVEGRMYQLRAKAWDLVRRKKIDPAVVPGSRASKRAAVGPR